MEQSSLPSKPVADFDWGELEEARDRIYTARLTVAQPPGTFTVDQFMARYKLSGPTARHNAISRIAHLKKIGVVEKVRDLWRAVWDEKQGRFQTIRVACYRLKK